MNNFIDTTLNVWIKSNKAASDQYGLALEAYEGGQALTAYDGLNAALKQAAQDDPRMGDFYKHLIRNWVGNGGHNFNHYALAGPWGAGGSWGMLQSIDQATSVKYAALESMVGWGIATTTEELAMATAATSTATPPPDEAKSVHKKSAVSGRGGYGLTFVPIALIRTSVKRAKSHRDLDSDDQLLLA